MHRVLPLYVYYIGKHYIKNLLIILFGMTFAFASIDYFQNMVGDEISVNLKVLYLFNRWQDALGMFYPLAIVFALILTKLTLVRQNTMVILHSFGYSNRKLFMPLFIIATLVYFIFIALHTTPFSYAKDKADTIMHKQAGSYSVNDLFFKYHDTFVYIKHLDPAKNKLKNMTLFKVANNRVEYSIKAQEAIYVDGVWHALSAVLKTHTYKGKNLVGFSEKEYALIKTLKGYKPKIMESFNEGKSLTIIDTLKAWKLLNAQGIGSAKVRSALYTKIVTPLFALALLFILFMKLPYYARMVHMGLVVVASLGATLVTWGLLFGLGKMAQNGVIFPEVASVIPILILFSYGIYLYFKRETYDRS